MHFKFFRPNYVPQVSSSLHSYLLPHLLPPKPALDIHGFRHQSNNNIQRHFKMSFVPAGFWERFIARMLISLNQMDIQVNTWQLNRPIKAIIAVIANIELEGTCWQCFWLGVYGSLWKRMVRRLGFQYVRYQFCWHFCKKIGDLYISMNI